MFFESLIRRRLLFLIQSWLREPPDIELKIGLIRSHLILKNLKFDPIPLNKLLDESSSYCFKELNIESLSLHFSNWSFPAFNIQAKGVYAVMSFGLVFALKFLVLSLVSIEIGIFAVFFFFSYL